MSTCIVCLEIDFETSDDISAALEQTYISRRKFVMKYELCEKFLAFQFFIETFTWHGEILVWTHIRCKDVKAWLAACSN